MPALASRALLRIDHSLPATGRQRCYDLARGIVLERARRIEHGRLEILDGAERFVIGAPSSEQPVSVSLGVVNPRFWLRVLAGGSVGAGESYVDGDWSSDDLVGVMRIFAHNQALLEQLDSGFARWVAKARRLWAALRRNTPD